MKKPALRRLVQRVLKQALVFWHKSFIKEHFKRSAYTRYAGFYPKPKPRGDPFVKSGALKQRMTRPRSMRSGQIKAVGLGARIAMPIGRPRVSGNNPIVFSARLQTYLDLGMSQKAAAAKAYKVGYGKANTDAFKKGIAAVSDGEKRKIAEFVGKALVREFGDPGQQRTTRIRIA